MGNREISRSTVSLIRIYQLVRPGRSARVISEHGERRRGEETQEAILRAERIFETRRRVPAVFEARSSAQGKRTDTLRTSLP